MFDFPQYKDLKYWFTPVYQNRFLVTQKESMNDIAYINVEESSDLYDIHYIPGVSLAPENTQIMQHDFMLYQQRPEYLINRPIILPDVVTDSKVLSQLTLEYNTRLAGVLMYKYMMKSKGNLSDVDPDNAQRIVEAAISWLEGNKFYIAPASSRYHEAFRGGLLLHSLRVYNQILSLCTLHQFKSVDIHSAVLVALAHDWCKIGMYESYNRNVKNELTGQWEQQEAFKINAVGIPMGHGATSMYYVSKFTNLSDEEALAIRWHMGPWYVCDSEVNDLQRSNETYPLVHMLQFADQLAITNYAN